MEIALFIPVGLAGGSLAAHVHAVKDHIDELSSELLNV
jgi:hypothetical protein